MSFLGCVCAGLGRGEGASRLLTHLQAGEAQVVVAYGTSLTHIGAWVGQVEKVLETQFPGQVTMINSGGSGMNSNWGLANLDQRVLQENPDTVFLEFAINDSVARFDLSVEKAQANLEDMIEQILKAHPDCEIILMTMTPGNAYSEGHRSHRKNIEAYYQMYRNLAKERGFLLIDHYPNWLKLQAEDPAHFKSLVPDTIHPTAAGCSEVVTPVVLKALGM
ncbi:GDSL-type esterase/lipase family protein [Kiritimatiellaeota bacterium B1221]|nr:GDSL-type esterase/lipase family protein [Kiritimatiellaeota bacterium B1221]